MDVKGTFLRTPQHLRLLIAMRAVAIPAIALILYCLDCVLEIELPVAPLAGLIGFYVLLDAGTFLRLAHPAPMGNAEMLAQLLLDAALLTAILYLTGGARNPVALYYLVLVLYSAIALPPRLVWVLAAVCLLAYGGLHFFYVALPPPLPTGIDLTLEDFGRLAIYVFIAVLVAWFGIKLSAIQSLQRQHVRAEAEKEARERYLLGLAALSAGTAHELSTPLSTISVVIGELRASEAPPPDWKDSIDMLWSQVQLCRRSLSALAGAAAVERLGEVRSVPASEFITDVAARFRSLRPAVRLKLGLYVKDDLLLNSDHTLLQALVNFVNNAADASPGSVELRAVQDRLNCSKLVIEVLDRGPGIAPELREKLGKGLITTKGPGSGHGAGILIAQAAIERFGGTVAISDRRSGGTCVRVELPGFRLKQKNEYQQSQAASG